ncbi:MAG: hypothetical protein ACOYXC_20225, partial [Candidatus Rifleibacteriota bacterium]
TFFDQAILFEVYCLEVFFIGAGMLVGLKIEKGDGGNFLAFLAGLIGALGVGHRPTFGLYALTLFFFIRQRSEPMAGLSLRWFFVGLASGFLPSLDLYLQLQNPGRLLLDPQIGQGISGFLRVFSGTVYSGGLFAFDTFELWQRFVFLLQFIFTDSSILLLPAAILALSINGGQHALKKALLVTAMVNLIFVLNYHAFEAHSMLLPCLFSLSALTAFSFQAVRKERARNLICAIVVVSSLMLAWTRLEPPDSASTDYCYRALTTVPAGSVLLMSNDVEFRPYYFLRLTRNFRPDIGVQLLDAVGPQELADLALLQSQKKVAATFIHPADALTSLIASFSIAADGYLFSLQDAEEPEKLFNQTAGSVSVKIDNSVFYLPDESSLAVSYGPGEAISYKYGFEGSSESFAGFRFWAILLDADDRPVSHNGLIAGHDGHVPSNFISLQLQQQANLKVALQRSLIVPHNLKPGQYRLRFFIENKNAGFYQPPDLYKSLEGVNIFNLYGFLEVFKLDYGLSNRLVLDRQTADKLLRSPLPGVWSAGNSLSVTISGER